MNFRAEEQVENIRERLARLERHCGGNRKWKRSGIITLIALIAVAVMGDKPHANSIIEAQKIILKDENGRTRASWEVKADKSVALELGDEGNVARIALRIPSSGAPEVLLRDTSGNVRAALGLQSDGQPTFAFFNAAGNTVGQFGVGTSGAHLELRDHNSTLRTTFETQPDGNVGLTLLDAVGHKSIKALVGIGGRPAISLFDHSGKQRLSLSIHSNGTPEISLFDDSGVRRFQSALLPDGTPIETREKPNTAQTTQQQ